MAKDKKRSRKAEPKKVEPILEGGDEEVEVEEQEEEAEDVPVGMNTGSDDGSSTGGDDSGEEDEDEAEDRRAVKRLMRAKPVQDTPVPAVPASHFDGGYKNKQRVLTLCSRGVTARARHLLEDLRKLIPHSKKEVKLDCKGDLQAINEIAEVKSCNNCLFLEARKRQDLYLWVAKTPLGPSVKLHLTNLHTMDELRLTGNAMLGSRPLLSFDASFDSEPHWRLIRALFTDVFGCPRGHPKSKPFIDRVMTFCVSNGRIWVRNYQIVDKSGTGTKAEARAVGQGDELTDLVEIGPRFVLCPIRIFGGSFGGPTLYQNPDFVSPNFVRAEAKRTEGAKLVQKMKQDATRKERKEKIVVPKDPLADLFRTKSD